MYREKNLKLKNQNKKHRLHIIIKTTYNRINQDAYKSLIYCEIKSAILRVQHLQASYTTH